MAVASSRMMMGASFSMARAMAIRRSAAGEMGAAPTHHGVKAVLQAGNKVVAASRVGGGFHLGVCGVSAAHADILPDRIVKEVVVLGDERHLVVKLRQGNVLQVMAPMVMVPDFTSQNPAISLARVDLPEPEGPTRAVMLF